MPAADEQHLIDRARQGSQDAFRCLVERHMKQAYNLAFGFVASHELAEDITQEAFIRVYRSLGTFRGESTFATWLHRIVVNLALNRKKRDRRTVGLDQIPANPSAPSFVSHHEQCEATVHLERALHELPTLQRAVVILRHLEGMSTRQVSVILQCSEGTVKTHLFRGMTKLKKKLAYLKVEAA